MARHFSIALKQLRPLYTYVLETLSRDEHCLSTVHRTPIARLGLRKCEACAYLWDCLAQILRKGLAKRVGRGRFTRVSASQS